MDEKQIQGAIGKRIREMRERLELSQDDLARSLGVTPQHISAIEQGKRLPSLSSLGKLAEELGATMDYLATGKRSVSADSIPAIKADARLSLKAKKAVISLLQELYARCDDSVDHR